MSLGTILCTLLILSGCSPKSVQYGHLDLVKVTGEVTLDQKPLPNAQVLFLADNKTYSYGVTDEKGKFKLNFNSQKEGVTPGEKKIEIWTTRQGPDFDLLMKTSFPKTETIPVKYNLQSVLKENVSETNNRFKFDLNSQGTKKAYFNPELQTE